MIKAVLFDFGGVLTESGKTGFIGDTVAELYNVPRESINIKDLHRQLRQGSIDEEAFFGELNKRYHGSVTKNMFLDKVHASFVPSSEVYDLAERLRKHDIRTGILSNVFAMNVQVLREEGWYEGFDPLVLSCEVGYSKPDPQIYQTALDRLQLSAPDVLFIDDQEKCLEPVRPMGMHTVLAESPLQIVRDVEQIIQQQNGITL